MIEPTTSSNEELLMDFADVIPRLLHSDLVWLGQRSEEWLSIKDGGSGRSVIIPRFEWLKEQNSYSRSIELTLTDYYKAARAAKLTIERYLGVLDNYDKLAEKYPNVRN